MNITLVAIKPYASHGTRRSVVMQQVYNAMLVKGLRNAHAIKQRLFLKRSEEFLSFRLLPKIKCFFVVVVFVFFKGGGGR